MRELWNERAVLIGAGLVLLLMVVTGGPPSTLAMSMPTLLLGGFLLGYMTRKHAVGGWLFVYFWGVAVTWLVAMPDYPRALLQSLGSMSETADATIWGAVVLAQFSAAIALLWASIRLLFRRTPESLLWVRRALWVTLGTLGVVLGLELLMAQVSEGRTSLTAALRPMLTSLVWMLYFERSKRVQRFVGHQAAQAGNVEAAKQLV